MESRLNIESDSLSRRTFLNFLTGTALATTAGAILYPIAKTLSPPAEQTGRGGAVTAKDKLGHEIPASQILSEAPGSRALVAGLAAEPTYLAVLDDGTLDKRGLVDNCPT